MQGKREACNVSEHDSNARNHSDFLHDYIADNRLPTSREPVEANNSHAMLAIVLHLERTNLDLIQRLLHSHNDHALALPERFGLRPRQLRQ